MPGIIDTPLWGSSRYVDGKAVATFVKTPKRNADRTDASRTIAPSEVAEAVWRAYHGTKLHWYVPPELEKNETVDFDANRDGQIERNRR